MLLKSYEYQLIHRQPYFDDSFANFTQSKKRIQKQSKIKKNKKIHKNPEKTCMKEEEGIFVLLGNLVIDMNILYPSSLSYNQSVSENHFDGQLIIKSTNQQQLDLFQSRKVQNTACNFFQEKVHNYNGIISAVEYFKKSDTLEVVYDSVVQGFYLTEFESLIDILKENKTSPFTFQADSQTSILQNLLSRYQEIITRVTPLNENDTLMRNQSFDISMKIAHQYLTQINGKQDQIDINLFPKIQNYTTSPSIQEIEKKSKQLFFYNGLKRTEYGYSIDRRGLNKNLIDLLNIGEDVLQQVILRKGFINFLSPDSNLKLLQFDLESRIMLAQQYKQKTTDLSQLKGRRIQAELITLDLIHIPCEIVIDIIQTSFGNEGWSQNYLMLFNIQINESEIQKVKCMRDQTNNMTHISLQKQSQQQIQACFYDGINTDFLYDYGYSNQSETFINNFYPDLSQQSSFNSINTAN